MTPEMQIIMTFAIFIALLAAGMAVPFAISVPALMAISSFRREIIRSLLQSARTSLSMALDQSGHPDPGSSNVR